VICNPLGKSGGALIQQFMIIGFGSLAASTPYLGIILLGIVLLWISAANSLAGQFAELQKVRARVVQGWTVGWLAALCWCSGGECA
jgi:AAA family ATP:ADP antiporter